MPTHFLRNLPATAKTAFSSNQDQPACNETNMPDQTETTSNKSTRTAKKGKEPATNRQVISSSDDESIEFEQPLEKAASIRYGKHGNRDKIVPQDEEDVEYDQESSDSELESITTDEEQDNTETEPTLPAEILAETHISKGYSIAKIANENRLIATPSEALARARADFKDNPDFMSKLAIMIARFHRSTTFGKDGKQNSFAHNAKVRRMKETCRRAVKEYVQTGFNVKYLPPTNIEILALRYCSPHGDGNSAIMAMLGELHLLHRGDAKTTTLETVPVTPSHLERRIETLESETKKIWSQLKTQSTISTEISNESRELRSIQRDINNRLTNIEGQLDKPNTPLRSKDRAASQDEDQPSSKRRRLRSNVLDDEFATRDRQKSSSVGPSRRQNQENDKETPSRRSSRNLRKNAQKFQFD